MVYLLVNNRTALTTTADGTADGTYTYTCPEVCITYALADIE